MARIVAIAALAALSGAAAAEYEWPLDLSPVLTSTFGEYRPGRFHAGIDLRTYGVGQPVYAPAAGYVSRIRTSPYGYGKAVYLQLEDGNTAVFAHLDRFEAPLAEYVFEAQHAQQSYTVDLYPETGEFPVEPGQRVAWSGRTGVGAPHLHYELRDSANDPIDPRQAGISWPDTTTPQFRRVILAPGDPDARVEGDMLPAIITTSQSTAGQFRTRRVRARGTIGVAVDVVNPAIEGGFDMGVYMLRTLVDGEEVFRVENDRLSYGAMNHGAVSWHPSYTNEGRFLLQWRWPDNESPNFRHSSGQGWFNVTPDSTEIVVEAEDFGGNTATLTIPLLYGPSRDPSPPPGGPPAFAYGDAAVEIHGEWLTITAEFSEPEPERPELDIDGVPAAAGGTFARINDTTYRAAYLPAEETGPVVLTVTHPRMDTYSETYFVTPRGGAAEFTFEPTPPPDLPEDLPPEWEALLYLGEEEAEEAPHITVRIPENAAFGRLIMTARPLPERAIDPPIPDVGYPFHTGPANLPLDAPIEIIFPFAASEAEDPSRVVLFRGTEEGWTPVTTERDGDALRVTTRQLGPFVALEDTLHPVIRGIEVILPQGAAATRRPFIRAGVYDEGSGIASVEAFLNGEWMIMRYDPEQDLMQWERDQDLPEGRHDLVLRATDRAGNTAERSFRLPIPFGE